MPSPTPNIGFISFHPHAEEYNNTAKQWFIDSDWVKSHFSQFYTIEEENNHIHCAFKVIPERFYKKREQATQQILDAIPGTYRCRERFCKISWTTNTYDDIGYALRYLFKGFYDSKQDTKHLASVNVSEQSILLGKKLAQEDHIKSIRKITILKQEDLFYSIDNYMQNTTPNNRSLNDFQLKLAGERKYHKLSNTQLENIYKQLELTYVQNDPLRVKGKE